MNQQSIKLGKIEGEGVMTRAEKQINAINNIEKAAEPVIEALSISKAKEFNPEAITNGLIDDPDEGGKSIARSTGLTGSDGSIVVTNPYGFNIPEQKNKYELSGFTARYTVLGKNDVASSEVRVYFNTADEAKKCIEDNKYTHTTPNGEVIICDISFGAPMVSYEEIAKFVYLDNKWSRP